MYFTRTGVGKLRPMKVLPAVLEHVNIDRKKKIHTHTRYFEVQYEG